MRAGQRKCRRIMGKRSGAPGIRIVTVGTLMRHLVRDVTGVQSPIKLRLVARPAFGRSSGELAADVDPNAAATLFIGSIQGLVMQSLLAGNVRRIRSAAPGAFAIFARGIRRTR